MDEVDINAPTPRKQETAQAPIDAAPNPIDMTPDTGPQVQESYRPNHHGHIAPMRTFNSDLAEAVREKGGSVVRIAIAEDERHRKDFEENSIKSKKNIVLIILSLVVIVGGITLAEVAYMHQQASIVKPVQPAPEPSSLIPADASQTLDITGMKAADVASGINAVVQNSGIQSGLVKNLVITTTAGSTVTRIPAPQFLTTINTQAPADFLASLSPQYMLGVYQYNTNGNLFLVLQGTEHDFLLSGMLEWEPHLFADMAPLFNVDTSTLAPADAANPAWSDMVIDNHDTRVVLDANKKVLIFYTFLDQNTILIATDPNTLAEVVQRYAP